MSFATREIRTGEMDGIDYHFVEPEAFRGMIERHEFAEWAEVHGNMYGTSVNTLKEAAQQGVDLLLDIDCQGAAQLKKNYHQAFLFLFLPPDMVELERRLRDRQTNNEDDISRRLKNADDEIKQAAWYDYLVVNDNFTMAKDKLRAIITAERSKADRNRFLLNKFTEEGAG